jgi:hypothetical protein
MVPRRGLEPPRPYGHQHLKLARLPIPPSGHAVARFKTATFLCQCKCKNYKAISSAADQAKRREIA